MPYEFVKRIEDLTLPAAFVLQRDLWRGQSPESIGRLLNLEAEHVEHAKGLIERDRELVAKASIEAMFPWNQESTFLQNGRVIGIYKRQLDFLRRNPTKILEVLRLPPALSPHGWQLDHARILLQFLRERAFDTHWTVTIRAAPSAMQLQAPAEPMREVARVLSPVASRIEIVQAQRIGSDERAVRVALSRPDMAGAPGLGDAIQAAALVAILHYRLICHEHALFAPLPGVVKR